MRSLGIDFGERRIGVAISDPEGRWALPLTTIERETDRRAVYRLVDLARREGVSELVIGRPRRPDGTDSAIAERIKRFGVKLETASGLPLVWIEETLTTCEARDRLARAGASSENAVSDADDMIAAQIILQEALDRKER